MDNLSLYCTLPRNCGLLFFPYLRWVRLCRTQWLNYPVGRGPRGISVSRGVMKFGSYYFIFNMEYLERKECTAYFWGKLYITSFTIFLEFLDQMNLDNKLSVFGSSFVYFLMLGLCPYFHFLNDIYLLSKKKEKKRGLRMFFLIHHKVILRSLTS